MPVRRRSGRGRSRKRVPQLCSFARATTWDCRTTARSLGSHRGPRRFPERDRTPGYDWGIPFAPEAPVFQLTPETIILIAIFLLIAFPVHEFAHAFVAWRLGDSTAKMFGRLTLNPIVHFDMIGGLFLIISALTGGFIFGWAKPTPVNPMNLRDRRNGEVPVAPAAPGSTP